ncbi:unnamed protein product [Durusdinium trenchii]|uniref:Ionotropic glutamate receptor C-terminal domain-containing protein n=2 Tax=Durusdinium trenchii TaxID=1381693 RepID=A0ABP0PHB1_9DINO
MGGLEIDILNELGLRAGFTYSMVIHDWSNITSFKKALAERIMLQDMITYAYWFITPGRMGIGAYSPYGFLEAMLFAVVVPKEKSMFSFDEIFSFLTPFSPAVWFCFLGLMIGTGLMYRFLETSNDEDFPEGRGLFDIRNFLDSIFKSSGHITGASGFAPKTWPGKVLLMSWTWCIVLTLSAYTANLASFLVMKAENAAGFSSLTSAVQQMKKVSVERGGPVETWFQNNYPDYPELQSVPLVPEERALKLTNQEHDTGIFAKFEVDMLKQRPNINPHCNMKTIGEPLLNIQAGWMVGNDVNENCTILVRDVLAVWFVRMDLDGTLSRLTKKSLTPVEYCPDAVEEAPAGATRLEFENMLGILSVHGAGVVAALILFCAGRAKRRMPDILTPRHRGTPAERSEEALTEIT